MLSSRFPEIAVCFFRNGFLRDDQISLALKNTGLLHFIAISGGQTQIAISAITRLPFLGIAFILRHFCSPTSILKVYEYLIPAFSSVISGFFTFFFGLTGSLQRVWMLRYTVSVPIFPKLSLYLSTRFPHFSVYFFQRLIASIILCMIFGNIWLDLSFLLSACGSASASIISNLFKINKKSYIFAIIAQNILSAATISILMMPLVQVSLPRAIIANILAAPIVDLWIVPLALVLLFMPTSVYMRDLLLSFFDKGIEFFLQIANILKDTSPAINQPWPPWSFLYLGILIVLLWSIQDYLLSRLKTRLQRMILR